MNESSALTELLGLERRPVAVQFQDTAPDGIDRIDVTAPSGCTYWKLASQGKTFYTLPEDHFGCPIGSHTHRIDLPEQQARELEEMVGTMVDLHYIDMAEVPEIPQLPRPFGVAVYAPLGESLEEPDVVLVVGNARQIMLLAEAAQAAGLAADTSMVGRPTCAAIPAVMASGRTASNLGCIGNRVYTELADDELYFAIAGPQLETILDKLAGIVHANTELEKFHQGRVA